MSKVTLTEFVQEMHDDLARFSTWWSKNNAARPDDFPMSYGDHDSGMWFEQFIGFCDMSKEEQEKTTPSSSYSGSDEFNQDSYDAWNGCGHE